MHNISYISKTLLNLECCSFQQQRIPFEFGSTLMPSHDAPQRSQTSPFYERFVPIALVVIVILMVVLGLVAVAVLAGWWPG